MSGERHSTTASRVSYRLRSMIGIVVGLIEEATLANRLGGVVSVGNGTANGAQRAVDELICRGVTALMSFGVAGGIAPGLRAGSIVVPKFVLTTAGKIACDMEMVRRLNGPSADSLMSPDVIVASVTEKAKLHAKTGAVAVDLESGIVAKSATAARLPFAVLRAICDPWNRAIPSAAMVALDERGQIRFLPVLAALARRPVEIISIIRLASDATAARRGLIRQVQTINADF